MALDNQAKKNNMDKSPLSQDSLLKKVLSYDFQTQKTIIDKDPSIIHQSDFKTKNTLLFISVRNDNYPLSEYLVDNNANINIQNVLGETPLHKAVENGSHKMINFLLDKGANPNIQQGFGETPMHIASSKGDYKVIKLLLLYKADPSILTTEGYLAEDYANERGNQKCVDVLSKARNQIEISDIVSSPLRAIKEQFSPDQNELNGTHSSPMNKFTKKKKTVEIKNSHLHPNIALSNPSDDDLQTDCDNLRYNGLNNYNRTPNHLAFTNNTRILYSERNNKGNCYVNNQGYDDDYDDDNNRDKKQNSEDNIVMEYKLPFEKINNKVGDSYSNWNNISSSKIDQPFITLISITELFQDISKEQIIFYSEKNDIIEEVYLRQSTVRVSLKKNNTLKNSKYVQNTYQDEYEFLEDQEHNYNNQLETIHDKQDNEDGNNLYNTSDQLNIPPAGFTESLEEKELYDYLKKIEMEKYADLLIKQGFDDLNILLGQMRTKKGITESNLKDAGITVPGHRARILIKLQLDAGAFEHKMNEGNAFYYSTKEMCNYLADDNLRSIYQWLLNIKLSSYFSNFYSNGYHSIDLLYFQTLSKNPLTEEILEKDIKIPKLGYRLRIINKLNEDSVIFLNRMIINTCSEVEFQNEMKSESCRCIIF